MERNIKVFRVHRLLYWISLALIIIIIGVLIVSHLGGLFGLVLLAPLVVVFLANFFAARGSSLESSSSAVMSCRLAVFGRASRLQCPTPDG